MPRCYILPRANRAVYLHAARRDLPGGPQHCGRTSTPVARSSRARRAGRTGGTAGVITAGTVRGQARLQRGSTRQAVVTGGIGGVIASRPVAPHTGGGATAAYQAIMTGSSHRVIAPRPVAPITECRAERTHLRHARGREQAHQESTEYPPETHLGDCPAYVHGSLHWSIAPLLRS